MLNESDTMNFVENGWLRQWLEHARAGARVGIVTDVDGTISPLAPTPQAARVTPKSRDLLRRLAGQITLVAAVSGRAADDLYERVNLPELVYIGSHGLERWHDGKIEASLIALSYLPALERVIAAIEPHMQSGMVLENKRVSLALHYRAVDDPAAVYAELAPIIAHASHANGLSYMEGKMVFEVLPDIQVDKGSALASLVHDYALSAAFYIGDDVTDAAALRMARELRQTEKGLFFGVGVKSSDTPASVQENADFMVDGVHGVEALLEWLSTALSASST
jgi:trehalose 6-phosphate phosphatase